MKTEGFHSMSILTSLEQLQGMRNLYEQLLGGKVAFEMPGVIVYEMPNQFIVELYTEIADMPSYLFSKQSMVPGFRTDDIESLYRHFQKENYILLSSIQQAGECYSYFHFMSPDQQVYSISELSDHPTT